MKTNKEVIIAIRLQELAQQLQCIVNELNVLINSPTKIKTATEKEIIRAKYARKLEAMLIKQANKKSRNE